MKCFTEPIHFQLDSGKFNKFKMRLSLDLDYLQKSGIFKQHPSKQNFSKRFSAMKRHACLFES